MQEVQEPFPETGYKIKPALRNILSFELKCIIYFLVFVLFLWSSVAEMTIVMRGSPAGGDTPQDGQQHSGNPVVVPPVPVTGTVQPVPPVQPQQPGAQQGEENGQGDVNIEQGEDTEPDFPLQELARLDEMINRPRWVVPVLPKGELEILLDASIKLCREGV